MIVQSNDIWIKSLRWQI